MKAKHLSKLFSQFSQERTKRVMEKLALVLQSNALVRALRLLFLVMSNVTC